MHLLCVSWREAIERQHGTKRSHFTASVQMSILCLCVCRSAFLFHFVSVFQFSLCVSQFPLLWSCLCFMSCPWRLALSSPVGSTDTLSFYLLIKSRFWKGEEERRSRLKQMQQCSGDCEFCAVDEYNLQTSDHAHVLSSSRCYSHPVPPVMRSAVISGYSSALLLPRAGWNLIGCCCSEK